MPRAIIVVIHGIIVYGFLETTMNHGRKDQMVLADSVKNMEQRPARNLACFKRYAAMEHLIQENRLRNIRGTFLLVKDVLRNLIGEDWRE